MSIEYTFQTVVLQYEDLQEKFPFLVNEIGEYLPVQKPPKKRRSKKKKTMGSLIEDIIDSMEK